MSIACGGIEGLATVWSHWMLSMGWQVTVLAAIIWCTTRVLRKSSASFRHALWLLVFLKLLLPPSLATPWSAGTLVTHLASAMDGEQGLGGALGMDDLLSERSGNSATGGIVQAPSVAKRATLAAVFRGEIAAHPATAIMMIWAAGTLVLLCVLIVQCGRYTRRAMRDSAPADERVRALVASQAQQQGVRRRFTVLVSPRTRIPSVFGFWRPKILLPESSIQTLSDQQLVSLAGHEIAHIQRHDIEVGWLMSIILCCYWFHPVAWLANVFARREREMACDDAVLYATKQEGKEYAATIVRMAESFDGSVPVGAGFLGMLEQSDNLLLRIRSTLDGTRARRFTWQSSMAVLLFLILLVPMGTWTRVATAQNSPVAANVEEEIQQFYAKADPDVQEYIRGTARNFGADGLWLAQNAFDGLTPAEREQKAAHDAEVLQGEYGRGLCDALAAAGVLRDKRLLPGLLKVAGYTRESGTYDCRPKWMAVAALGRMGDESAVPTLVPLVDHYNENTRMWARASLVRLTGQNLGADKQAWAAWWNGTGKGPKIDLAQLKPWVLPEQAAEQPRGAAPRLVSSSPANRTTDIDPALDRLQVTFDQDMDEGFSWTGGPPYYPTTAGDPTWVDKRTCELPVQLEAGKFYRIGINSKSYQNFRSAAGVPVRPQVIVFTTRGAGPSVVAALDPPKVVSLVPENGASGVSPGLDWLTVTFDRAMGGGFSWTGGGENYPETTEKPQWSEDKKTCLLPVKLKPGWTYRLGLNSPSHNNFQSEYGLPLEPVVWRFSTGKE